MIAPIAIRLEATQITLGKETRIYQEHAFEPSHLFFVEAARIDSGDDKGAVCGFLRHIPQHTDDDGYVNPAYYQTITHIGSHHTLNTTMEAALHHLMALAYSYRAQGL